MQESMNRDGIGCSQNLVLDTTLVRIKLIDVGEMTDCRPKNMRSFHPDSFETHKTKVLQRGAPRTDHHRKFDDLAFQN